MATHSSILDWRISWTEVPDRIQSMGLQRVGHGWATNTFKKTNKVDEIQEIQNTAKNKPYSLSLLNDGTNSNYFVLEKLPFMLSPTLCCYHYCFCLSSFQAHDRNAMSYHVCCSVWPCWRRQWHPTPVLLPGKSHGWRNLVDCSPWGREESDTTERLHFHFSLSCIREGNGNPLQCSCLENPRGGGAWWAAVYGVAQSRTWLKQLSSSSISMAMLLAFFLIN